MKYFAVSDVHDHYDLLMEALRKNGFARENRDHHLILCGDAFYSGPQPGEMFSLLKSLHEEGRLIFIYGNHDVELLDNLRAGAFRRPGNRTCAALLVEHLTGKTGLRDEELIAACDRLSFTDFLEKVPVWYYETEDHIFTHGFIPVKSHAYRPDWRDAAEKEWRTAASRGDAMLLSMRYGIREPGKTIVCGHYSAARCYLMKGAASADWEKKLYKDVSKVPAEGFRPFYGDGFIAIDASVKKTGSVNCIVLDEATGES